MNGAVEYCDMGITDEGQPIVTFLDITYSNTISAMKYDGSNWSFVGPQGFSGTAGSYPQIDVLGNTPYVAYSDVPLGEKATVRAYMSANAAVITANPSSIVFDTTAVGQVANQIVAISNMGDVALEVTNVSSSSTFFSADVTSFTVEPGDTYEMTITFEPQNELWYEGEIILQNNDPVNAELSIDVGGYGDYGLGTDDYLMNNTHIYPNPASDRCYIKAGNDMDRIVGMDYAGRIVLDKEVAGRQIEIMTAEMNAGMYFIRIFSSNEVVTRKLVIEK